MNLKNMGLNIILLIMSATIAIKITPYMKQFYALIIDKKIILNDKNTSLVQNISLKDNIFLTKELTLFNKEIESLKLKRIELNFLINKEKNGLGKNNIQGCHLSCIKLQKKLLAVNNLILQYEKTISKKKKTLDENLSLTKTQ